MNPLIGFGLIVALVIALIIARAAAAARRKRRLQRQARKRPAASRPRSTSERAEMRAYEDPEALARDITTTGGGTGEPPSHKKR